jgi:fermentation-respiration switch protein FrsA (DUF1100 family)
VRTEVEFNAVDGTVLRGWLYLPEGADAVPGVVMTHGLSGVKEQIQWTAEVLCDGGLAVLLYDHRNCGASDGEPRQEFDPVAQTRDMLQALTFLSAQSTVDAERIGLWGTSFSGGQVLKATALDKRVKAVVCQVPFISGLETLRRTLTIDQLEGLRGALVADRAAQLAGDPPATITLATLDPEEAAFGTDPRAYYFQMESEPARISPSWENFMTLRTINYIMEQDVRPYVPYVSPAPLLMIVGKEDKSTPTDIALAAFETALEPKRLVMIPGDHYSPYFRDEDFHRCSSAALEWFTQHLLESPVTQLHFSTPVTAR